MRLSSVTTSVSPDRRYSMSWSQPGRSIRDPVIFSENTFPQPAFVNASN